ncbi:MAG: acetolactate synthase isozyme1 large subunit [Boseongicola sp.]|nr:MAG: acetolactate synthase isozyme1 large subunit [Boseongicola sp.]
MLASRGVDTIFGIPGVHNVELYRGIEEAGLAHVLARHEQGAGFMADGYARASGRPGVAYVISGPGLTNIMTPLGQAYSDSVPVLVIASCLDDTETYRGQLHQMRDQAGAARAAAEWSETAEDDDQAFAMIDSALASFSQGRSRPKVMHVPINALGNEASLFPAFMSQQSSSPRPPDVAEVARLIRQSRRPMFIFGGGAKCPNNPGLPAEAMQKSRATAFTTFAGRGILAPDTPMSFGAHLAQIDAIDVLQKADLLIAVGTELAAVDFYRETLGHDCPLVRVDVDPEVLADVYQASVRIKSESADFLSALIDQLGNPDTDWSRQDVADARARWRRELAASQPAIVSICDALSQSLPDEIMIYSDMTQFAYTANEIWQMRRPGHWHHPSGFGTLGYALPAAIGGIIARKGAPTLAIAGDYGFQYTLQELGTAAELGLNLPILLWDNSGLAAIHDAMVESQIAPTAVQAKNPDWSLLAKAYECEFAQPASLIQLSESIHGAFKADKPTLIRVTPEITNPNGL